MLSTDSPSRRCIAASHGLHRHGVGGGLARCEQRPSVAARHSLHRRGVGGGLRLSPVSNSVLVSTDPASVGPRLDTTPESHSPRQVSTDPASVGPRLEAINPYQSPLVSCLSAPMQIQTHSLNVRGVALRRRKNLRGTQRKKLLVVRMTRMKKDERAKCWTEKWRTEK